jgi:hypothetical protein
MLNNYYLNQGEFQNYTTETHIIIFNHIGSHMMQQIYNTIKPLDSKLLNKIYSDT